MASSTDASNTLDISDPSPHVLYDQCYPENETETETEGSTMTRISSDSTAYLKRPPPYSSSHDKFGRIVATASEVLNYRQYPRAFWLCTALLFLVELGSAILGAPSPRLLEMAVCRNHFRDQGHVPDEQSCKEIEVQLLFTALLTGLTTLSTLAATCMQMVMGTIADKHGRRLAIKLNIASILLYWGSTAAFGLLGDTPIWCFYLAPLFILIGGGPWATGPLIFAAISTGVTPQQRTTAFSVLEATSGIADLLGPILGALTMTIHISIPFVVALAIFGSMYIPALLITDDGNSKIPVRVRDAESNDPCITSEHDPLLPCGTPPGGDTFADQATNIPLGPKRAILAAGFGSFFLFYLARDSTNYLIPWVSLRFDISMAYAGILFSLRAIVSLILYFVLLPFTSSWLTKAFILSASTKDLVISIGSTAFSSIGYLIVALAPNIPVLATGFAVSVLGSGITITLRSFLASFVDPTFHGRLFAAVSTVGTIGSLIGMPLMGEVHSWGIKHGKVAIGLTFLISAISSIIILAMLLYFRYKHWRLD